MSVKSLPQKKPTNDSVSSTPQIKRYDFVLKIIKESSLETTAHGISPLIKRQHPCIRLVWLVCLVASAVVCSYLVTLGVLSYFDYETITKNQQVYLISTDFPAVSICNANLFMTNQSVEFVYKLLRENYNLNETKIEAIFNDFTAADIQNFKYFLGTNALDPNLTDEFRRSLGYQIDDMLFSCTYNLLPCSSADFVWFYDILHGNCFTFNAGNFTFGF